MCLYVFLLSAHLYSFIVDDECKKRARVQMCEMSVCSCRYNPAGLFDMIKSACKVLVRNTDYFYWKKAWGPAAAAQPFSQKSVRVFVVVWAQGPFFLSAACDVLVLNHTRRGWLPFFKKKKDGEINARARALDTKRLAGITFSFHLPSNHDSIHFVAKSSREDAFGKVLRAFRGG
jgi:hypothetical protein